MIYLEIATVILPEMIKTSQEDILIHQCQMDWFENDGMLRLRHAIQNRQVGPAEGTLGVTKKKIKN